MGRGGAGVEQQMVMDGDRVHNLPLWEATGRCGGNRPYNSPACRFRGESVGPLSPVCPGGPHVCAGRSPAESPTPSSQTPGSYCFSPFGCPARGPNRDRYLHWGHSRSRLLHRSLTEGPVTRL